MGLAEYLRQKAADDWLSPLITDHRRARSRAEGWGEPATYVSPSMVHSPCALNAQLAMLGHHDAFSDRGIVRMDNGKDVHRRLTAELDEVGALRAYELRLTTFADGWRTFDPDVFNDEHELSERGLELIDEHGAITWSGEADVMVHRPGEPRRLYVGEIKSANRFAFGKLPPQVDDPVVMARRMLAVPGYVGGYVRQLLTYWVKLREVWTDFYADEELAETSFLLFENTDTQEFALRWVRPDPALLVEVARPALEAQAATAEGRLLDAPYVKRSTICSECWRERVCYALQDGDEDEWLRARAALRTAADRMATT